MGYIALMFFKRLANDGFFNFFQVIIFKNNTFNIFSRLRK